MIFFLTVTISLLIFFLISAYNFITSPVLRRNKTESNELVSLLIPARNEEKNISKLLDGILKQTYKSIEIIIYDDQSEDNTSAVVENYIRNGTKIKLIKGGELPEGWTGKNYACWQLAQNSSGNYLLFIDADVELESEAVSSVMYEVNRKKLEMFSLFPTQKIKSFGEFLIVPLMNWFLLTFLPLDLVYKSRSISFIAANGQLLLIKKEIYNDIDGHKGVRNKIVEDMELARKIKTSGYKVETLLGGDLVFCRMYNNFSDAFRGFVKNFYPGTNLNKTIFISLSLILFVIMFSPFIISITDSLYLIPLVLILAARALTSSVSNQNSAINVLFFPLHLIIVLIIALSSVTASIRKSSTWKGRKL